MFTQTFEALLQELSETLHLPPLRPDGKNSCTLHFSQTDLDIQLELDEQRELLLIACAIGEVTPGRFREDLLEAALRYNNEPYLSHGNLAYLTKSSLLYLCDQLPLKAVQIEELTSYFHLFSSKALLWREALQSGRLPTISSPHGARPFLFGLHP